MSVTLDNIYGMAQHLHCPGTNCLSRQYYVSRRLDNQEYGVLLTSRKAPTSTAALRCMMSLSSAVDMVPLSLLLPSPPCTPPLQV